MKLNKIPKHVAIIMDGNGRWAQKRNLPRSAGHKKGADAVKKAVEAAMELGIDYLTLYAFSTENWKRPVEEVNLLMNLLREYMKRDVEEYASKGVCVKFIGERYMLDDDIVDMIEKTEEKTKDNKKLTICIALSYGSRLEIISSVKKIAKMVKSGEIEIDNIDENLVSNSLYTHGIPDPDLVIRTSGERRVSNYLLWQLAYAEFMFVEECWPEFDKDLFVKILEDYNNRERRYGNVN
jgi:undecaprenyl diphosphate synthase